MGTLSQSRETLKSCKMVFKIHDDEVIDAAKEEKTEDAADGKAAEPEAAEAEEEKNKENILAYYSTKIKIQTMVFFNSNTNYLQALKKINPSLQKKTSSKIPTSLGHISIDYLDDEITVFWAIKKKVYAQKKKKILQKKKKKKKKKS